MAAEHTTKVRLGTAIAIAFARNPMNLANLGYDMQWISGGCFLLGLGSQVKPHTHTEKRFSSMWFHPAERMTEIATVIKAIWDCWRATDRSISRASSITTHNDPGIQPQAQFLRITADLYWRLRTADDVRGRRSGRRLHFPPFNTRDSLLKNTLPALPKGLEKSGRLRSDLEVICATLVDTADTEEAFAAVKLAARKQLDFYGSAPAYHPALACHGWEAVHEKLKRLSKEGRWDDMTNLISDDIHNEIAVVGERRETAGKLRARLDAIADGVSIMHNRCPDPHHWSDIVRDLKNSHQ